jgi:hypothetical protein
MTIVPSWLRWPPNSCETCTGWKRDPGNRWIGVCDKGSSLDAGTTTDARYRCPAFERKQGA